jgi:hypothetical protein
MKAIWEHWREAKAKASAGGESAALLERFSALVAGLERKLAAAETSAGHLAKASEFLDLVRAAHARLGDQFFDPSYLLNVVGDAVVRTGLLAEEAVEFLRVGLYFHGQRVIDRRFASRSAVYHSLHAEMTASFYGRESLKRLVAEGREKIASGKVFCLTYYYLNELKKAYWAHLRRSQDALDRAAAESDAGELSIQTAESSLDASDRVELMMEIFRRKLTATQQMAYLAKNRKGESAAALAEAAGRVEPEFLRLLQGLDAELDGHGNLGWTEIAERLEINEKSAKREYLRALHTLLHESSRAVFGVEVESAYVRRVLAQLREIVYEKDLRIRSNAGEGLSRLVEKWEVALRFVLNHGRVPA